MNLLSDSGERESRRRFAKVTPVLKRRDGPKQAQRVIWTDMGENDLSFRDFGDPRRPNTAQSQENDFEESPNPFIQMARREGFAREQSSLCEPTSAQSRTGLFRHSMAEFDRMHTCPAIAFTLIEGINYSCIRPRFRSNMCNRSEDNWEHWPIRHYRYRHPRFHSSTYIHRCQNSSQMASAAVLSRRHPEPHWHKPGRKYQRRFPGSHARGRFRSNCRPLHQSSTRG